MTHVTEDASTENRERRSRRLVAESAVIVLSILAALLINTWWAGVQEHRRARAEIANLRAEFDAVGAELDRASAELNGALEATHRMAELAGPHPQRIDADTFGILLTRSLSVNAVALQTGALANLLSSGDLPILEDLGLQNALASWPSIASLMSVKFAALVTDRDEHVLPVMNGDLAFSPMLAHTWPAVWKDAHAFDFDPKPVLSSRQFENAMTQRWIGMQIALITVNDAQKLAKSISAQLKAWR